MLGMPVDLAFHLGDSSGSNLMIAVPHWVAPAPPPAAPAADGLATPSIGPLREGLQDLPPEVAAALGRVAR